MKAAAPSSSLGPPLFEPRTRPQGHEIQGRQARKNTVGPSSLGRTL